MQIILLEKVENLGKLGDQVKVKAGYGRNFLIPSGKAVPASKENIEFFDKRREELEQKAAEILAEAQALRERVNGLSVVIRSKAGDEGKLFGSVTSIEICEVINAQGVAIEKRQIRMPDGPIRVIGKYEFVVHLHTDVDATVTVAVEAE